MSGVDELVAFVRAQLDEDERVAREVAERAPHDEWDATGARGEDDVARSHAEVVGIARPHATPAARSIAEHIARWDPARVLAKVKADRRILDYLTTYSDDPYTTDGLSLRILSNLAQPYAGHEGWREEWRT